MVKEGLSLIDIVESLEKNKRKVKQYAMVDTLDYLLKRGRISKSQYVIGNILQMKIILTSNEGELIVETKVRGANKARKWLEEKYFSDKDNIDFSKSLSICYREDKDIELKGAAFEEIRSNNHLKIDISSLILLFTGETAVGLGYFVK